MERLWVSDRKVFKFDVTEVGSPEIFTYISFGAIQQNSLLKEGHKSEVGQSHINL